MSKLKTNDTKFQRKKPERTQPTDATNSASGWQGSCGPFRGSTGAKNGPRHLCHEVHFGGNFTTNLQSRKLGVKKGDGGGSYA